MPRSTKPRKKHDPRRALSMAQRLANRSIERQPLRDSQTRDLGIAYRVAFDLLRSGRGTEESWSTLACALDMADVFAGCGIGPEHEALIGDALDGMARAKERSKRTGRWVLDGDALNDVRNALMVYDAQIEAATVGDMREAIAEVERRIDAKFALPAAQGAAEPQRMAA